MVDKVVGRRWWGSGKGLAEASRDSLLRKTLRIPQGLFKRLHFRIVLCPFRVLVAHVPRQLHTSNGKCLHKGIYANVPDVIVDRRFLKQEPTVLDSAQRVPAESSESNNN